MIIEIVDEESRIDAFLPNLNALIEEARCGGLVTMEKVNIVRHLHEVVPGKS